MALRETLNRNPWIAVVVAIAILAGALIVLSQTIAGGGSGPVTGAGYWFDTGSGELFTAPATSNLHGYVAPIEAPSGSTGVRAFVSACGSCDNESERIITYQSLTEAGIALAAKTEIDFKTGEQLMAESIVSADAKTWVPLDSQDGRRIVNRAAEQCGETKTTCYP